MNDQLNQLRQKIDTIDHQILSLITDRAALLNDVLQAKIDHSTSDDILIFHPKREQAIIQNLISKNNSVLSDHDITHIYRAIISVCRTLQINKISNSQSFTLAIQGDKGSHSEQAARQYCSIKNLQHYHINYATISENVLNQISANPQWHGVVALNNAQGGLVEETIAALSQHKYLIVDSIVLRVEHSLLTLPGTDPKSIKQIYSHSQALRQCKDYLQTHYPQCVLIPWKDTALAATDLLAGKLPKDSAAIAHQRCATDTELTVVDKNIQDLGAHNETLFLLISGQPHD